MPRKRNNIPENYNAPLPTHLRELMRDTGHTQAELASYLGISRQSVSCYTDGSANPTPMTIVAIARFFNVSTDYLLGLTREKSVDANIRQVCNYTGLNEDSVNYLHNLSVRTGQAMLIFINDLLSAPILINKLLDYFASSFHRLSDIEPYRTIYDRLPHSLTLLDERIKMGVIFDALPQERQHFFNRYKDNEYVCEQMFFELLSKENTESLTDSHILPDLLSHMFVPPIDDAEKQFLAAVARFLAFNPKTAYIAQGQGIDLQHFIKMGEEESNNGKPQEND